MGKLKKQNKIGLSSAFSIQQWLMLYLIICSHFLGSAFSQEQTLFGNCESQDALDDADMAASSVTTAPMLFRANNTAPVTGLADYYYRLFRGNGIERYQAPVIDPLAQAKHDAFGFIDQLPENVAQALLEKRMQEMIIAPAGRCRMFMDHLETISQDSFIRSLISSVLMDNNFRIILHRSEWKQNDYQLDRGTKTLFFNLENFNYYRNTNKFIRSMLETVFRKYSQHIQDNLSGLQTSLNDGDAYFFRAQATSEDKKWLRAQLNGHPLISQPNLKSYNPAEYMATHIELDSAHNIPRSDAYRTITERIFSLYGKYPVTIIERHYGFIHEIVKDIVNEQKDELKYQAETPLEPTILDESAYVHLAKLHTAQDNLKETFENASYYIQVIKDMSIHPKHRYQQLARNILSNIVNFGGSDDNRYLTVEKRIIASARIEIAKFEFEEGQYRFCFDSLNRAMDNYGIPPGDKDTVANTYVRLGFQFCKDADSERCVAAFGRAVSNGAALNQEARAVMVKAVKDQRGKKISIKAKA